MIAKMQRRSRESKVHWSSYFGLVGLAWAAQLLITPYSRCTPFLMGVAMHLVCDFSLQTPWMSAAKASEKPALLLHSAAAGFIPLAAVGMMGGNPALALMGGLTGFISHLAIDSCAKFGLPFVLGFVLDQGLHITIILACAVMVALA